MNIQRNFVSMGVTAAFMLGLIGGTLSAASAQERHPHYLHAISDLRDARAWLTAGGENNVMGREMEAVVNIDKALADIKRASIDDGKDLKDHMLIDANIKHRGRLHKAEALIAAARRDLNFKEDDMVALGWRRDAVKHVNAADNADKQAIRDVRNDS